MRTLPASAALLALLASCQRTPPAAPAAPAAVDSKTCAGCHAALYAEYRKTGMGRSFAAATAATLTVEDFERNNRLEHKPSDRGYQMLRREGRYFLRREQTGYQGAIANVVEKEIHYVLGSGNLSRSYLHRTAENRLNELPVSWYAEDGGKWAMSPGYDFDRHLDFRRAAAYSCLFCHNGYPAVAPGSDKPGADPVYPAAMPEGIDCQRCHGPGRAHVDAASTAQPAEKIRAAILNPKRLDAARGMEVCMQCHLETTSFPLPNSVQRLDRGVFSYNPAEPLSNYILHFDHAKGAGREDKFEIVSSAYRLRQSACFLKSAGKLQCTTCHDPHRESRGAAAETRVRAACQSCHAKSHDPGPACASCHMPKRRTEDVVHAAVTDHRIARRPKGNLLAVRAERHEVEGVSYRGPVEPYYPKSPAGADAELYVALAQTGQSSNLRPGIEALEAAIRKHRPQLPDFAVELAQALAKDGRRDAAIRWFSEAASANPNFAPALRGMGAEYAKSGQIFQAIEALERARQQAPRDSGTHLELARAYRKAGRSADAIGEAAEAARLDPDLVEAHELLGGLRMEAGDAGLAEKSLREAIRLQPDYAEAHNDLANLLAAVGDLAQAEFHFQAAIRLAPREAATRFNFGVLLAMQRRFADAEAQFTAAVAANPQMAEAYESLGNLAGQRRDWRAAKRHYERALQAKPRFDRAELGLGMALAALGDLPAARAMLERAARSDTPQVRDEAVSLLSEMGRR